MKASPLPLHFAILAFAAWLVGTACAQVKQARPEDVYLQGYMLMDDGLKLNAAGKFDLAYYKLREARDIFDSVAVSHPSWNPDIVEYRRSKVREKMEEAKQKEIARRQAVSDKSGTPPPPLEKGPREIRPATVEVSPPNPAVPSSPAMAPAPATATAVFTQRIADMEARIKELTAKNEGINQELGAKKQELTASHRALADLKAETDPLRKRLANAEAKIETSSAAKKREQEELVSQVKDLQADLEKATNLLLDANEKNGALLADLEKAYADIKSLNEERTNLVREKEQMLALLEGDSSPDKVKALIAENEKLKKSLQEAQAAVAMVRKEKGDLAKAREADQGVIKELQGRIESLTGELATLRQANTDYQAQMAALTQRLDETEQALGQQGEQAPSEAEAVVENRILRDIIFSQLKQQAGRERAKQRAVDLLTENNALGAELMQAMNEMAAPFELTKEERMILQARVGDQTKDGGLELFVDVDSTAPITANNAAAPPLPSDIPGDVPPLPADAPPPNRPSGALDKAGLNDELRGFATAAEVHFSSGQFTQAEDNFLRIKNVEPQNVYALCNLGVVQLRVGKIEEAISNLTDAIAFDYDNSSAHYLLAMAYLRQKKLTQASDSIGLALRLNPDNAQGHMVLGMIYKAQGKTSSFIGELEKAVEIDDSCADAHYNLAVHYALKNEISTARRHYSAARKGGAERDSKLEKFLQI